MSMGMYVAAMLRGWMRDAPPAETRALELRVGQIVRGVLLQMLEDGEGLVNIGGALVRARLETSLQPGKGTLLQVMPGSGGSTVVLKVLGDGMVAAPEEGLKEALKSFGLPEQKWAYELLRSLRSDGYSIGKDTAAYFQKALALRPAGVDPAGWMLAAEAAFRRGLDASAETIHALRQALFGQPFREELAAFVDKLNAWLKNGEAVSPRAAELAGRLLALLAQGEEILNEGLRQLAKGAPAAFGNPLSLQQEAARPSPQAGLSQGGAARPAAVGIAGAAQPNVAQGLTAGNTPQQPAGAQQAAPGANAPVPPAQNQTAHLAGAASARTGSGMMPEDAPIAQPPPAGSGEGTPTGAAQQQAAGAASLAGQSAQAAAQRAEPNWIGRFLQWLGVSHEHQLVKEWGLARRADAGPATLPHDAQLPAGERSSGEALRSAQDTLKSALMAMARMEEIPPQIREAAQSLVHHITGQQLLLASERQASSPVSLMTIFVPIKGEDGETTATIHVQTRRGHKGEWDASNCRLLFDLNMRYLGETIVDVQVTDKIVSVKILNDYPAMADLAAQARHELEEGLRAAGYQLLSMTVQPLPAMPDQAPAEQAEKEETKTAAGAATYVWTPKPYKGVDYRV